VDAAELIRSPQNAKLKLVRALRANKERQFVLLEGARVLLDALHRQVAVEWLLHAPDLDRKAQRVLNDFRQAGIECLPCEATLLAVGSDLDSEPGLLAVAARPQADPHSVFAQIAAQQGVLLVSAGVQDPGNVGALVRVAAGLGADAVLFLRGGASPWHPRALRGASGTTFRIPVIEGLPVDEFLSLAARHKLALWGTAAGAVSVNQLPAPGAVALLLGEEGRGMAAELVEACQQTVGIPLQRGVESLNVATAAAIFVQQLIQAKSPDQGLANSKTDFDSTTDSDRAADS
jgi:RNA methyltransferase, TrmH family